MAANTTAITKTQAYEYPSSGTAALTTRTFHIVMSAPAAASIVVKGRARQTSRTYQPIPYKKRYLNGAVGDDSYVSTAITDTSIIEVNSAGLDISLDVTFSAGTVTADTDEMVG